MDFSFSNLNFNSVVTDNVAMLPGIEKLPGFEARATFTVNSASVFYEDVEIVSTIVDDKFSWGGNNQMPFNLLTLIEKDETLATYQCFNSEVCYGSGLQYCTTEASPSVKSATEDSTLDKDIAAYFFGICQDFKYFGFAVLVLLLNEDGTNNVRLRRNQVFVFRRVIK